MATDTKKRRRQQRRMLAAMTVDPAGMSDAELSAAEAQMKQATARHLADYIEGQLLTRLAAIEGRAPTPEALRQQGASRVRTVLAGGRQVREQSFRWRGETILTVRWWLDRNGLHITSNEGHNDGSH